MKCQHIYADTQCQQEATRDVRVRAGLRGWRLFLCDEHVEEAVEELRAIIDRMAVEQAAQETNNST